MMCEGTREVMRDDAMQEMLCGARAVGQAFGKFIIAEAGGCILCVDQHAADERVRWPAALASLR